MAVDSERMTRIAAALTEARLDALICSSATEVLLLTGFWPVMGNSVAICTSHGEVQVIVPEDELELAQLTSSCQIHPYRPGGLDTLEDPLHRIEEPLRLATRGLDHSRIGLQLSQGAQPSSYADGTQFRASMLELLQQLHPNATFVSCDALLEALKAAKTPKELRLITTACRVAATGFARAAEAIQPGKKETEVAAAMQQVFETTPQACCLQRSYGYFFCMSGPNSATAAAAYARTRQRRIEPGDLVMIHANTCADGYWTDITRTYTAGEVSPPRHGELRVAIMEARAAGLAAVRPGVTGRDVDRAVRSVMQARGLGKAFSHATGHGVGFAAANSNGLPRIHPLSPDVLEEGMTFNIEPAAYFKGYGGMRHCDVVAVTRDGAQVITDF